MAEILVLNRSDLPPGSLWEQGDPVVVAPDGWAWGREERNVAKFRIVRIAQPLRAVAARLGVPPEQFRPDVPMAIPEWEEPDGDNVRTVARRRVKLIGDQLEVKHRADRP
jgi:hypothetical protein